MLTPRRIGEQGQVQEIIVSCGGTPTHRVSHVLDREDERLDIRPDRARNAQGNDHAISIRKVASARPEISN